MKVVPVFASGLFVRALSSEKKWPLPELEFGMTGEFIVQKFISDLMLDMIEKSFEDWAIFHIMFQITQIKGHHN